jgi:hypothetical protein
MVGYAFANPPYGAQADRPGQFPKSGAKSGPNLTTVPPWFGQTRMKSGATRTPISAGRNHAGDLGQRTERQCNLR